MVNSKTFYVVLSVFLISLLGTSLVAFSKKKEGAAVAPPIENPFFLRSELLDYISKNPCDKIDAVFTWVNGSDPGFVAEVEKYKGPSKNRYGEYGTLRFAVRSAIKNIKALQNVYIVTNGQVPSWLATGENASDRIHLVTHKDIFLGESSTYLPVFNSNSIELHLQNIPNLTECFLYFNDDCFINKPLGMDHFLHPNNSLILQFDRKYSAPKYAWSPSQWHRSTTYANTVLNRLYHPKEPNTTHRYPCHNVHFLRKSILEYIHNVWDKEIVETASSRFRTEKDIPIFFMHHNVALEEGLGTEKTCDTKVVGWRNKHDHNTWAWNKIKGNKHTTFCIQDEFSDQTSGSFKNETKFLEEMLCVKYPQKSFAEKDDDANPCAPSKNEIVQVSRNVDNSPIKVNNSSSGSSSSSSSSSSDCDCDK